MPIVIDSNKIIICGHTRLKAAKELKLQSVPCVIADDLSEEQVKAFRLADNKVGEIAEWDFDLLSEELEGIDDLDMTDFGFLDGLDDETEEVEGIEEDEVPEVEEEATTQYGDLYILGNHRLLCGDSTKQEDVSRLMDGGKADMVFTDPPYGYKYQSNGRTKTKKFDVLQNDDKFLDFFPCIKTCCNGFVFICTTWKVIREGIDMFTKYYDLSNMIIWDKGGGGIGDLKHTFSTDYEIILCSNNGAEIKGKRIGSVWSIAKDAASDYVTQKPVELSATAIRNCTEKENIVLDVFGGSGSTMMACEQLNRKCYTMELDPKYCDVIVKRWENLTGEKAQLIRKG